ncbi:MAG: hypothetical protein AB8U25_00495 [Rickettsiales endosymbiont of Dermacentor nuttalli]
MSYTRTAKAAANCLHREQMNCLELAAQKQYGKAYHNLKDKEQNISLI